MNNSLSTIAELLNDDSALKGMQTIVERHKREEASRIDKQWVSEKSDRKRWHFPLNQDVETTEHS